MYFRKPNAFFLIEVLRALAERGGGLSAVGRGQLPEQVCAGGISAVLERRLAGVPAWARLGLRRCAVGGRRLELRALPRWVAEPARFLQACADVGVLEVVFDEWQFSHDKLRERILESLAPAEARVLHYDVAEALQWAYPDASQHSAAIAEHYEHAGSVCRAAAHRVRAAAVALHHGALEAAVHHGRAALAAPVGALTALEQAQAQQQLVQALFGLRRIDECIAAAGSAAAAASGTLCLGRQVERAVPAGLWLLRRLLRRQAPAAERALAREQLLTGLLSAEAHVLRGDARAVGFLALRNLKLAEQADDAALRAMSSVGVGFLAEVGGLRRLSDRLLGRSARYLQGIQDPRAQLEYLRISGLVLIGRGELARGEAQLTAALRCADELESDELRLFVRSLQTISAALHGHCGRTRERARALAHAAGPSQHPQYRVAGQLYLALADLRAGDLAQAAAAVEAAAALQGLSQLPALDFCLAARRGQLALARAETGAAAQWAEQALVMLAALPVYTPAHVHYFGSLIEVCLGLAQAAESSRERARFLLGAERTLGSLRTLIRRHPVAQGPCWLYEGLLAEQRGQPERARSLLDRARARAEQLGLPLDLGRARRALGKLDRESVDPAVSRRACEHLRVAATLLGQLGAQAEQAEALQLLAPPNRKSVARPTRSRAVGLAAYAEASSAGREPVSASGC